MSGFAFRGEVRAPDREAVRSILASSGFFHPFEIDVAEELVEERLAKGEASGYHFVFIEIEGKPAGYACYGPIACTQGSFDLYWIAVHQGFRGRGLGRRLLAESEERIKKLGGRRVYIETSSRPLYEPTRSFYLACGYRREAALQDFYGPGDAKEIFVKVL